MTATTTIESALGALREKDTAAAADQLRAGLAELQDGDTEGHIRKAFSDERLKQAVSQVEDALAYLERLTTERTADRDDDVEGHLRRGFSDAELKQAITKVENALALLCKVETETTGVEAHAFQIGE